jgi:histidinol dehydrogenase
VASPRQLSSADPGFADELERLLAFEAAQDPRVEQATAQILESVRQRGDAALLELTARFDRWTPARGPDLLVSPEAARAALRELAQAQREALELAAGRIRAFHARQLQESWRFDEGDGTVLGQQVTPLDRVGLYVPGGKAAYPSSVLMTAIAAKVAGVRELVMTTPTPGGELNRAVLAAAALAGVDRIVRIGGAQAVGALAFGTESVPAVDKIVGPGNAYVAAAKRKVFGRVGIDMVAGPSEVLVIADGSANADWVAMDLFSQAEHDEIAQAILLTPEAALLERVAESMRRQIGGLPRRAIIEASLAARGALIRVRDLDEACRIANRIAPEHLELAVADPEKLLAKIRHAGAIFLGHHASESLGDYCAGPNHVLPTSRTARFSSPLGVYDFPKRSSVIGVSREAARRLGRTAATLARAEGLEAHARSAEWRMDDKAARSHEDS